MERNRREERNSDKKEV
uniref:Uncharacterized protein n=1 Tax=Rhizophora mucronata TaxID=61149 RepID=A0A2P2JFX6_RHIMU